MSNRKPKASYACAPCKRLKIRCDHQVPCSSCVRNARQHECLSSPAKSLTQFKQLIKPNVSFGRVAKPPSPTRPQTLAVRKQSKSSSISSISSFEGQYSSPEESAAHTHFPTPSSSSSVARAGSSTDNAMLMEAVVKDQSARLDELSQRNAFLSQRNTELVRQVGFYFHVASRPGIQDFAIPHLDNDRLMNLKKMMVCLLPVRNVGAILKKHFFVCVSYLNDILDSTEFERDYEKMWSNIVNDRVVSVDLSFLALVFMVLSLGLRAAPRELILSNEGLLRLWGSPQAVENSCTQWFRASRQILAFYKHPGLLRSQVFALQSNYCYLLNDMDTLDELLPLAVYDAKMIKLNDPSRNTSEIGRSIWWNLCHIDTTRSLDSHKTPFIMACHSRVELPKKSLYLKHRAQIAKSISTLYNYDFFSMSLASKLQTVVSVDQQIASIASQISSSTSGKVARFQRTALYTEICIHRYRLYESFLPRDISIASAVCTQLTLTAFDSYNELKQFYIVSQDPLYIVLSPLLVRLAIMSSVFLIRHTRLNLADIDTIKSNVHALQGDLVAMECFSPLPVVALGIQGMQYLESVKLQLRRKSFDSIKIRLNSIINTPERITVGSVPLGMMNESLRLCQEAQGFDKDEEKERVEEEIQRRWGEMYEDYCAYVR